MNIKSILLHTLLKIEKELLQGENKSYKHFNWAVIWGKGIVFYMIVWLINVMSHIICISTIQWCGQNKGKQKKEVLFLGGGGVSELQRRI